MDIYEQLQEQVKEYEQLGCLDQSKTLGIQGMPPGYALMINADYSHYFWLRYDGKESVIHWDRWAVYRWARNKYKESQKSCHA